MTGPANDVVVDTLRLRGAHGRRLARVAARALPAALDRALADVGDLEVASVHVVLDLDPEEHDDETLAVLWADLVRAELVARSPRRPVATPQVTARAEEAPAPAPASGPEEGLAAARAWSAAAPRGDAPLPAALLALGDPATAASVAAVLGPQEWARLVRLLGAALGLPGLSVAARPAAGDGSADPQAPPAAAGGRSPGATAAVPPAGPSSPPPARAPSGSPRAAVPSAAEGADAPGGVLDVLRVLAELRSGRTGPLDPAAVTRCAGLVLLYPWLAEHCRLAEELHPALEPVDVREAALAAVLGEPGYADDPLVGLLAGRPVPGADPVPRVPLQRAAEVADAADGVLASFAALLPGFERSTPGFVREGWLLRPGVLDMDRDPVLLTAATQPLDVLLPALPYPLGLLRLPWSPPLSVRFRP